MKDDIITFHISKKDKKRLEMIKNKLNMDTSKTMRALIQIYYMFILTGKESKK